MTQANRVLSTPPTNTPIDTTRRGFLGGTVAALAAGTAVNVAALATIHPAAAASDPILGAIERHRRAYQDWVDNLGTDEIEAAVPRERRQSNLVGALYDDPDWRVAGDDPRWIAHIETAVRTSREMDAASIALVSNDSLSLGGAVALLDYVAEFEAKDHEGWPANLVDGDGELQTFHYFLIENLAYCLSDLVPVSA